MFLIKIIYVLWVFQSFDFYTKSYRLNLTLGTFLAQTENHRYNSQLKSSKKH